MAVPGNASAVAGETATVGDLCKDSSGIRWGFIGDGICAYTDVICRYMIQTRGVYGGIMMGRIGKRY